MSALLPKLTDADHKRMIRLRETGLHITVIAQRFGTTTTRVRTVLERANVTAPTARYPGGPFLGASIRHSPKAGLDTLR